MVKRIANAAVTAVAAFTLVVAMMPLVPATPAIADEPSELESRVTETASAYNSAVSEQERLAGEIASANEKIADLEKTLPTQQQRGNQSLISLYKFSYESSSTLSVLLSSNSITEMLSMLDSYNWIIDYNLDEVEKTANMKEDLENSKSKLESDKAAADAAVSTAETALAEAKAAREEAAKKAAEKAAAEKAAAEAAKASPTATAEEKEDAKVVTSGGTTTSPEVNWSSSKSAFVNKWAPRINSYLDGSPTAGTGRTYAEAAWDNGVDPRWAPAISCIESTKGNACFASYNAWGYGGRSFSSWADGINTVVASLGSSLYGGQLTLEAARTYCPPTYRDWYSKVKNEMSKI